MINIHDGSNGVGKIFVDAAVYGENYIASET